MIFYRPISKPKAMTFDLDDTLYDNMPAIIRAESELKAKMAEQFPIAASLSRQQLMAVKKQLIANDHRLAWDMGELRKQTLAHIIKDEAGPKTQEASLALFHYFYEVRSQITIDSAILNLLIELGNKIPLVGITNGNVNAEAIGLSSVFQTIYHAALDNPSKPHSHMFNLAANKLRLSPQNILHVGDGLINDIEGGYRAGFMTAWYAIDRPMALHKEKMSVLPHLQLDKLTELREFI